MTIKLKPFEKPTPPPQLWEGHVTPEPCGDIVCVRAVFPNGKPVVDGQLVTIGERGLIRCINVNPTLGFPLDPRGRIMLDGEPDYPARIAKLEAEVERLKGTEARLEGTEAPPDKGAWRATEEDTERHGTCLHWGEESRLWFAGDWQVVEVGSWVREQPPPPPGGGA